MNNQEKIKALQEQLASLQEQINNLVEDKVINYPPMLPDEGSYYLEIYNFTPAVNNGGILTFASKEHDQNTFPSEDVAKGYSEAFKVMLELRRCEGAGHYDEDGHAYGFDTNDHEVIGEDRDCVWAFSVVPPFPTEELAQAAIDKVGNDRIVKAAKFLANAQAD